MTKVTIKNVSHLVELELTGPTSISINIRTTCSKSLAVFVSNDSSLSVRPRILFVVELDIAEMACVSSNVRRTFHVPSGVRVQRSISERDVSHPGKFSVLFREFRNPFHYCCKRNSSSLLSYFLEL